jgi:hexulose-6-phosphate isomerase
MLPGSGESSVQTSIRISHLQGTVPIMALVARATAAGFDAIELGIADDGPLTWNTPEAECRRLAEGIRQVGLVVSALVAGGSVEAGLISVDVAARKTAAEQIVAALDRAGWLGTDALVLRLAPEGGEIPAARAAGYEITYSLALDVMLGLRFEAEQRAVQIVCGSDWNCFWGSPLEVRRFIDQVNSPWVGVSLDIAKAMPSGSIVDWLTLLGHRIARIYVGDGPATAESICRSAVTEALRRVRYDAPICYCSSAEPEQVGSLLASIASPMDRSIGDALKKGPGG